jgi:hypothetical protein
MPLSAGVFEVRDEAIWSPPPGGHAITLELAAVAPGQVVAIHLNTLLTLPPDDPAVAAELTADDWARLNRLLGGRARDVGVREDPGHPPADAGLRADRLLGNAPGSLRNSRSPSRYFSAFVYLPQSLSFWVFTI